MVSTLLDGTSGMIRIVLPSHLLKLLTGAVSDLLVSRAHLNRVDLATSKFALGAVEGWMVLAIMH